MSTEIFKKMKDRMAKAIEVLETELSGLRTGRASLHLLDGIKVDYYGTPTPINQVASLSVPESRTILIQPWDTSQMQVIEKAIMTSDLGLTPTNDGKVIRITMPQLTEERRKELVKVAKKYAEECRVSIRNIRRDANDEVKKLEKDKEVSQDEAKKLLDQVQEITDENISTVDDIISRKEKEIMEV